MNFLLFYFICGVYNIAYGFSINNKKLHELLLNMPSRSLPFEDCAAKYNVAFLHIPNCNRVPCPFERGSTQNVNVEFHDHNNDTSFLKHSVHWIFNTIKTEAFITPDPCDDHQACIITGENKRKFYWASVHVNNTLPVLTGRMIWQAFNQHNECMICFRIPVVVK